MAGMVTEQLVLNSLESCNDFLRDNIMFSNGKNFRLKFLYATSAKSRWDYENLWGIYLAKPGFSWMALWIAVTSRTAIKKRQIKYLAPKIGEGDHVGSVAIYNPENIGLDKIFLDEAYLYLFDPDNFLAFPRLDILSINKAEKGSEILQNGFQRVTIDRRGKKYSTIARQQESPLFVDIDEWQVAVVGVPEMVPSTEVIITGELIKEMASRIIWSAEEIGEEYIAIK